MTVTGILLRFNGGHRYVGTPDAVERFIRIDTDHEPLATGLCTEYLALHANDADTISTTGRVLADGQIPSDSYVPGDHMDGRLVQGYSVDMIPAGGDGEGQADVTLELGDRLQERIDDIERRIERASRGVATHAATPQINEAPEPKGNDKTPPPYSLGQVLYPSRSPAWSVSSPFWVGFMEVTLETAGESASLIRLWQNHKMVGECWIEAGETRAVAKIKPESNGLGFTPKDFMIMEIKVAGTDAANLAVVLRGAIVGD